MIIIFSLILALGLLAARVIHRQALSKLQPIRVRAGRRTYRRGR